ncbi:hypothetical protein C8R43DRAFT_1019340 [Mycena crocata]|nr:hypothetical protein C8R43DRAFT_1019340 [Mycena crocata]
MAAPVSDWKDSFQLAKDTIENRVDAHQRYLSASGPNQNHVPNLVDLAAERLSLEDSESLDNIPLVILAANISKWQRIPYPAMSRALLRISCEGESMEDPIKSIDEWILLNEKWLRDGNQVQWQQGLVTLDDADSVFPNSILSNKGRTIKRPGALPGYEVLCDAREPQITIQPSSEAFKRTFDSMSDGLLRHVNWSNLLVAGGIVLGTLLSVDTTANGQPLPDPRWASSDIDIYIYGLSTNAANQKIKNLFETFRANLPADTPTLVVRNCTTITFYARYPLRRIQIVLKLVKSPKSVLLNFDLDVCAMGWDGATLWMLPRTARALETGCSVFTMNLISGHYLSDRRASTQERIFKYADKGYGIRILPSYISSLTATKSVPGQRSGPKFDILSIANEERAFTAQQAKQTPSYMLLESLIPRRAGYRGSRCLKGFRIFMRWVALWEMGQRNEVELRKNIWASTAYQDAMINYDEAPTPQYKWDEQFDIAVFEKHISRSNTEEITDWFETDYHHRLEPHGIMDSRGSYGDHLTVFRRMTCGPTVESILARTQDIMMQVLLPCAFAVYANDLVSRAQASAGLPEEQLLVPVVSKCNFLQEPGPQTDGLFYWRIGKELMWQQLDRRIDEVFEMLYVFRRVNESLRESDLLQAERFRGELSRREIYGEFDAFSTWVAQRPKPTSSEVMSAYEFF